jgi:hypothetical protein
VPLALPAKPASPLTGSMQVTDDQVTGLKTGQWVVLLGSAKAPEIGGEIKPAPSRRAEVASHGALH